MRYRSRGAHIYIYIFLMLEKLCIGTNINTKRSNNLRELKNSNFHLAMKEETVGIHLAALQVHFALTPSYSQNQSLAQLAKHSNILGVYVGPRQVNPFSLKSGTYGG